jgi:hypothetical protein
MNIFRRQGGICLKNSLLVGTLCHLANDQFHRNSRAPDDWFSQHDFGVDFDPIVSSHCRSLPRGHWCPPRRNLYHRLIPSIACLTLHSDFFVFINNDLIANGGLRSIRHCSHQTQASQDREWAGMECRAKSRTADLRYRRLPPPHCCSANQTTARASSEQGTGTQL